VVIPLATRQCLLLQRNLIYTGITREQLVMLIGQRSALGIAVHSNCTDSRFSGLSERMQGKSSTVSRWPLGMSNVSLFGRLW
jgi:exodeoxyribonuclease V alpha subunit